MTLSRWRISIHVAKAKLRGFADALEGVADVCHLGVEVLKEEFGCGYG
jgi:hypothetical protein